MAPVIREARRSEPMACRRPVGRLGENMDPQAVGRRPPLLSSCLPSYAPAARPAWGHVDAPRSDWRAVRPVLGDITNAVRARPACAVPPPVAATCQALPPPVLLLAPVSRPAADLPAVSAWARPPFNAPFDGDEGDVQMVADYAAEVHENNLQTQLALMPSPCYMDAQTDINAKMRAILVDWLVEVHMTYRCRPETLYLTVNIIDRYLSVRIVRRRKLQLLGVVAMFIASKFEELRPPKVADFAHITDDTYTKADILSMETVVLAALDFELVTPTPAHFFDRLARVNGSDAQHRCLAQYCAELSLVDIRAIRHAPSVLVSAALLLSNELLGRRPAWPAAMVHHSRLRDTDPEMVACAQVLRSMLDEAPKASLQAVRRKYQQEQYSGVANLAFGSLAS